MPPRRGADPGERPFPRPEDEGEDDDDGQEDEFLPQLEATAPPLRRLLPRAGPELERAVARCLAPDPADRPGAMAELLPVLNGLIRSGPKMWPSDLDPTAAGALSRGGLPRRQGAA